MQIDWITVLAQLVNFALLIWLLQKLLYAPILKLIARREAEIVARIDVAETKAKAADKDRENLAAEHAALNASREQVVADAVKVGEAEAKALLERARKKASQARAAWQKDMEAQAEQNSQALARDAISQLERIASRCLRDLAGDDLQHAMARQLVEALTNNPSANKSDSVQNSLRQGPVSITSPKPLSPQTQKHLTTALEKIAGADIDIEFETDDTLGPGLIVRADKQTFAWTIDSYLADFMRRARTVMDGAREEELPHLSQVTSS